MSRTRKGTKGPGYEYWSRVTWAWGKWAAVPGKFSKKVAHRKLRRENKKAEPPEPAGQGGICS